jgi:RNA polymerase sigma-70 factor (ECF subfamily)
MPTSTAHSSEAPRPKNYFATTHWSVVLTAGRSDTTRAGDALAKLCQTYWFPLYAYVRRHGHSPEDAKDLTQGFFARLIEQQTLANADPNRGRFRSFMLGAMNHFLADELAKQQTLKRGGGHILFSLDWAAAEERFDLEPADDASPDKIFDKQWAAALLGAVLNQLAEEYRRSGKSALFEALKLTLNGPRESQPYSALASSLQMNEGAVKVAVHRLRKRYRALLQAEIENTLASREEAKEEMRHLFEVLAG